MYNLQTIRRKGGSGKNEIQQILGNRRKTKHRKQKTKAISEISSNTAIITTNMSGLNLPNQEKISTDKTKSHLQGT